MKYISTTREIDPDTTAGRYHILVDLDVSYELMYELICSNSSAHPAAMTREEIAQVLGIELVELLVRNIVDIQASAKKVE